jgi:RHS repeat-associated protein
VPDSESYSYDSSYRLTGFQRGVGGIPALQNTWTLDGVGNIVKLNGASQQYSSLNQLTNQAGGATVLYDRNGNEIDDGTYTYTYDAFNRLRTVTQEAGNVLVATYEYDGQGRRIAKVVTNSGAQNGTTTYALDGVREIQENNGAGTLTQQYVYGIGINEVLVMDRNLTGGGTATAPGDQRLFYNENALGSIYALTNTSGQILEGYMYDAYGRQTVFTPGVSGVVTFTAADVITPAGLSLLANPFLFAGMRLDGETDLYYDRSRYFNAVQNQYLSQDPAGPSMGSTNLYVYADDNPTNLVDPLGLACSCRPVLIFGNAIVASDKKRYENWRSYLFYVMSAFPSNTKLELKNHAWGGAYFGLWYRHGDPKADSTLNIICMGDACTIDSSLTGQIESEDSIVRVYTNVDRQRNGDTLRVEVTMGAALSASGGPEISAQAMGGGVKMTWPDAKYGAVEAMGTFIWKCEK